MTFSNFQFILRIVFPLALALSALFVNAEEETLKLMAYNVEHLNEDDEAGCVPRTDDDYLEIAQNIEKAGPDIVGFQEVETAAAAARIFPADKWVIEFSGRPNTGKGNECRQLPGKHLRHLGTGFAIRKGLDYERNPDFSALGLDDNFQRWGTDITLMHEDKPALRLLSVHLKSGCWGPPQDERAADACPQLHEQSAVLTEWVKVSSAEPIPFVVLGDFNRRLALENDWMWAQLNADLPISLELLDEGVGAKCDPRYKDFIDHFVLDHRAFKYYVQDSFVEIPRTSDHPDHCALTAELML